MRVRKPSYASLVLSVLAILAVAPSDAPAQIVARVSGHVTDEEGNPLSGVEVYIKDMSTNTVLRPAKTNKKGRYLYTSIQPGAYIVFPQLEGYLCARQIADITGPDGSNNVMTWFYDDQQIFDKEVRVFATGDVTSKSENTIDFLMTTPEVHTRVVNRLYAEFHGEDVEAEEEAEEAPKVEISSLDKALQFLASDNQAAAVPFLMLAVEEEEDPERLMEANYQLGKTSLEAGDLDTAERSLTKAKDLDPSKPGVHFHLARVFHKKGMKPEALEALMQEMEVSPDSEAVLGAMAALYRDTGETAKAIETYEQIIEANPENYDAYSDLAALYKELGDRAKEEDVYKRMGERDPTGQSFYNLGNLAFNRDEREKAKFYYERVIEKNPKHAMAHYQLANTMLALGDIQGAVTHLEQFVKLKPKDEKAAEARGTIKALKEMLGTS